MIASMKFIFVLFGGLALLAGGGFVWLFNNMPSANQIVDFASETAPGLLDEMSAVLVPDDGSSDTVTAPDGVPTTFPETNAESSGASAATAVWLTPEQQQLLDTFGVDVEQLPETLTPALTACLQAAWGENRYNEVLGGATPTIFEGAKAVSCL